MGKSFDARRSQGEANAASRGLVGRFFRHFKGDNYLVLSTTVDEATGEVRVNYIRVDEGEKQGWVWSRTIENFLDVFPDGQKRFTSVK